MNRINNSYALKEIKPADEITWNVETYSYQTIMYDNRIWLHDDLSDKVVNVTYDCDSSSNIKMSASVTFIDPLHEQYWFMRKEHETVIYSDWDNNYGSVGGSPNQWVPVLYKITEKFYYKREDKTYVRDYGFFIPDSNSAVYDSTTNTVTLQLQGMAAGFTSEFGGQIQTPMRSHDYYLYRKGRFSTEIRHYETEETPDLSSVITDSNKVKKIKEISSDEELTKKPVKSYEDKFKISDKNTTDTENSNNSIINKQIMSPLPVTISNTESDGKTLILYSDYSILYEIVAGYTPWVLNTWLYPIKGFYETNYMDIRILPNDLDFDETVCFSDIIDKFLEITLKGYHYWVDEKRRFCIDCTPRTRGGSHGCKMFFADYGQAVIDEEVSFSDNEFYTVTEVYGKDNEYYGIYYGSIDSTPNIEWESGTIYMGRGYGEYRKQTIVDNNIESNMEAFRRAMYETFKSTRGHETVTVKLRDDGWLNNLTCPSLIVGYPIEYRMMNGETNMMILDKASLSDNVWTFTMSFFHNDDSAVDLDKSINQIIYNYKWYLEAPTIYRHEMIDGDTVRLYITGEDVQAAQVCRIYSNLYGGAYNTSNFIGETANRLENGDFYFDLKLSQSGHYDFSALLYSWCFDEYAASNTYRVDLTIEIPERVKNPYLEDNDPMSPVTWEHDPYILIPINQILTDENGNRLTI